MATMAAPARGSRIDLRMTGEQKRQIERAAEANGMSLSQWAIDRLLASARRDMELARAAEMDEAAFDAFAAALDEPAPPALGRLAALEFPWSR